MQYTPLVSIIIPVYKGDPFLREAIDSCLNQTYSNIEIIVVNDGSPDNGKTEAIAKSYGDKIRYFHKDNGGVATALNFGIAQMKGEWFSWLSHDDLYEPDKIQKQIEAVSLLKDKTCVVRCSTSSINENGNAIFRPQRHVKGYFSSAEMMKLHSLKEVGLYGCTLLIHKNILSQCGSFDSSLRVLQDEDYWTRIMFYGFPFLSISDTLVKIRVHGKQATNLLEDRFAPERLILTEKVVDYFNQNPTETQKLIEIFACKQAKEHRKKERLILCKAIKQKCGYSFRRHIMISFYSLFGILYSSAKKTYRRLVIARHRR